MNLPSFLWLWKMAAWSMGLSIFSYFWLGISGIWMYRRRNRKLTRPQWLRPFHYIIGTILVLLVLLLLAIGVVGTLGHYGSLGHSPHLLAGLSVVMLTLISGASATQIKPKRLWARSLHIGTNVVLFVGLCWVLMTGWNAVQKYLPRDYSF